MSALSTKVWLEKLDGRKSRKVFFHGKIEYCIVVSAIRNLEKNSAWNITLIEKKSQIAFGFGWFWTLQKAEIVSYSKSRTFQNQ